MIKHLVFAATFVLVATHAVLTQGPLKIVVIAGEDAVNVIQQKTAVAPIVEVRDRNELPVAGATVVFTINGSGATFAGAQTLTVVTNAAGQATAAGLTPTAAGALRISATATFQGQTATVALAQSNVLTSAEAAKLANVDASAGGGGLSAGAIVGIVGGVGAVGAGAAMALGGSGSDSSAAATSATNSTLTSTSATTTGGTSTTAPTPTTPTPAPVTNSAPVINTVTTSPAIGLVGVTPVAFDVQATDADNSSLTYLWEFPDGSTSDQRAFSRIFNVGGTHNSRITVRDGNTSTSREFSFEMKTVSGRWDSQRSSFFSLVQEGSTIAGTYTRSFVDGPVSCPIVGSIRSSAPQMILHAAASTCSYRTNQTATGELASFTYQIRFELELDESLSVLRGTETSDTTTTFRGTVISTTFTSTIELRKR